MEFRLPELGEGVYEAELVSWLVKPGDAVKRGQGLLEVLTDKATMEVPAPFAGTIDALRAEPGRQIKVGEVVLTFTPAEQPATVASSTAKAAVETAPRQVIALPRNQNGVSAGATNNRLSLQAAPSVRQMARK